MSQEPMQALPPVSREENVRIGPISVFALIIIICMAVLAVLTISTANASLVLSQRQAVATQELYLDETAAQTFLAEMDDHLATVRTGTSSTTNVSAEALRTIEDNLVPMRNAAQDAVDGQVEIICNVDGQQVKAEFSCANGRTLKIVVTILSNGTYRIDKWKMTAVENVEQPMGNLYTGA